MVKEMGEGGYGYKVENKCDFAAAEKKQDCLLLGEASVTVLRVST